MPQNRPILRRKCWADLCRSSWGHTVNPGGCLSRQDRPPAGARQDAVGARELLEGVGERVGRVILNAPVVARGRGVSRFDRLTALSLSKGRGDRFECDAYARVASNPR